MGEHKYWQYLSWSVADLVDRITELEQENQRLQGYGTTVERRPYRDGTLVLEYRRAKSGKLTGPYWTFRWREEGRPRSVYVGKTDEPERVLEEKLKERGRT
jgi:hypothetical protein